MLAPARPRKLAKVLFVELAEGSLGGVVSSGSDTGRVPPRARVSLLTTYPTTYHTLADLLGYQGTWADWCQARTAEP